MTTSNKTLAAIREILEASCKTFNKVASDQAKLNEKRTGSYTGTVQAGIEAGTLEAFKTVYDGLKADINGNVGGIARKLGCKLGKADKEGNASYTVPGGLMNAAAVVIYCLSNGIKLTDAKGNARTFKELQTARTEALAAAKEAEGIAKLTPTQVAQEEVRKLAATLAAGANGLTMGEAQEVAKILANLIAMESGSKEEAKKAA